VFSIGGGYEGLSVADYRPFLRYLALNGYIVCAVNSDPLTSFHTGVSNEAEAERLTVNYVSLSSFSLANAVDLEAIGALGHSRGGDSVIIQAATDNRIKAILGMGVANETGAFNASRYVEVPAMLILGSVDPNAPLEETVSYYNNFAGPKEYIEIAGAGHDLGIWNGVPYEFDYNQTTTPTTQKYVLSWFNYFLYSNSTALNVFSDSGLTHDASLGIIDEYSISLNNDLLDSVASAIAGAGISSLLLQLLSSTLLLEALFYAFLRYNPIQIMRKTFLKQLSRLGLKKQRILEFRPIKSICLK
jgi:hypothetical protein